MSVATENGQTTAEKIPPELLEQVVREVLRRLQTSAPPLPLGEGRGEGAVLSAPQLPRQLLITLDDVIAHTGGPALHIARRAVITPAARDYLKQRGIQIIRGDAQTKTPTSPSTAIRVVVATAATSFEPSALVSELRRAGHQVEQIARSGLTDVVAELAVLIARGGDLGMLATDETAAALCLANRHRGVRAVAAVDRRSLAKAVAAVGANLLILDTLAVRPHQVRPLAQDFCRGGVRTCPEAYRRRLEATAAS